MCNTLVCLEGIESIISKLLSEYFWDLEMLEISFTFLFNCAHQIFNFKKKMITQDDKPPVQNPH